MFISLTVNPPAPFPSIDFDVLNGSVVLTSVALPCLPPTNEAMKTCIVTLCLSLLLSLQLWGVSAFTTKQFLSRSSAVSNTELFFFGGPKDDGSPGDYVCKVGSVFYLTMGLCVFVCVCPTGLMVVRVLVVTYFPCFLVVVRLDCGTKLTFVSMSHTKSDIISQYLTPRILFYLDFL